MNVHDFIETNIDNNYSSNDLPDEVKNICKKLNDILNKPNSNLSNEYLGLLMEQKNEDEIMNLVSDLFECMQQKLFLYLEDLFDMLRIYQKNKKIKSNRDHYHHSIQCFLLGLSVYPFLKGKYSHNNSNFLANIFSMCFYHDLGYLYHLISDDDLEQIRKKMLGFFYDKNGTVLIDNFTKILSLPKSPEEEYLKFLYNRQHRIWLVPDISPYEEKNLGDRINCIFIQGQTANHAFESAVILNRLINLKEDYYSNNSVSAAPNSIITGVQQKTISKGYTDFLEVLKSVVFHNYKIQGLINFKENFWPCFLMLVDEMQTYGRPFEKSNLNYKLINPLHVDFDTNSGKIKMEINACGNAYISSLQNKLREDAQSEYNKHSGKTVRDALKEK